MSGSTPRPEWLTPGASGTARRPWIAGEPALSPAGGAARSWDLAPLRARNDPLAEPQPPEQIAASARFVSLLFREAEIDQALEAVASRMHAEGALAAQTDEMMAQRALLEQILAGLADGSQAQSRMIEQTVQELIAVFLKALEALKPDLEKDLLRHALEPLILDNLQRSGQADAVEIQVAEEQVVWLEQCLEGAAAQAGVNQALTIIGETGLAPGEARIRWRRGHAVCDATGVIETVLATLRSGLLGSGDAASDGQAVLADTHRELSADPDMEPDMPTQSEIECGTEP